MAGNDHDAEQFTELSARHEKAIVALLNEPSVSKAAVAAGIGERTLHRWLDQPVFLAAYRKARREMFAHAIGLTQKYAPFAVQTLVKVMAESNVNAAAKVAAATALLKFSRESIELDDLAERIERLERSAPDNNNTGGVGSSGMSTA